MKNYLISYPRSGNTATRYLFELMTNKPTNGVCGRLNPNDVLQEPLIHKNSTDYCMHKRHDFKGVDNEDMIFFVVRNPIEACIRHNEAPRGIELDKMMNYIDGWFTLLMQYEMHKGNKMLFYYENLIKIGKQGSKNIYPDAQSNGDVRFHTRKLSAEDEQKLWKYISEQHSWLYLKYIKPFYG